MYEIKDYWIVFTKSERWHQHFMKKNFGHCYVIYKDQYGCWCGIDPSRHQLTPMILPFIPEIDVPHVFAKDFESFKVIKISKKIDERICFFKFGFNCLSCVEIVKYVLNLKIKASTPYKLYRKLFNLTQDKYAKYGIDAITLL